MEAKEAGKAVTAVRLTGSLIYHATVCVQRARTSSGEETVGETHPKIRSLQKLYYQIAGRSWL
jgi:hypothetical protein